MKQDYQRWLAEVRDPELHRQLREMQPDEIEDAFGRALSFGTGGLRGILGAGTNRMNVYLVRRATQGLANYLKAKKLPLSVAIAHDSRLHSREFAEAAACVLAANGIRVWLYPRLEPTPALSWAVRQLSCGAGICITASHNPAQYNGYKVYGPDGGQITLDAAQAIEGEIAGIDCFTGVQSCGYETACAAGQITAIPDSILDAFLDAVLALRLTREPCKNLKLVYTPLCGSGMELAQKLFEKLAIPDVTVVPEQQKPDGRFPSCPYPNPELPQAMEAGLRLCKEQQADLLLATDPDSDRCGAAVRDREGEYRLLSGNEMGILLLDFLCKMRSEQQTMPQSPVAVTTVVSTGMADRIAAHYGVELRRTLTGFKYIGEQIGLLERTGQAGRFLFGFEESCGYLSGTHVRDKDGINAMLLICQMASHYKAQGKTLPDVLEELFRQYGWYQTGQVVRTLNGETGMAAMRALLQRLRACPPQQLAGFPVTKLRDYLPGLNGLPAADMLEFCLPCGRLLLRPSGTEPKLKLYLEVSSPTRAEAAQRYAALHEAAETLLQK